MTIYSATLRNYDAIFTYKILNNTVTYLQFNSIVALLLHYIQKEEYSRLLSDLLFRRPCGDESKDGSPNNNTT